MPNNAKINLIGNLTRDPETKDVNGNTVVSMSVAVNTNVRNQDGTYKSDFYDVSVWGKPGEALMQRLQKGSGVWVSGEFTSGEYVGRDGKNHVSLRVNNADVRGIARLKGEGGGGAHTAARRAEPASENDVVPF